MDFNLEVLESLDLSPGCRITQVDLEAIIGFSEKDDPKRFNLRRLNLSEFLQNKLTEEWLEDDEIGISCMIRQDKGALKLMDNAEVIDYCTSLRDRDLRSMKKRIFHLRHRKASSLSDFEKHAQQAELGFLRMKIQGHRKAMHAYPVLKEEKGEVKRPFPDRKNRKRLLG